MKATPALEPTSATTTAKTTAPRAERGDQYQCAEYRDRKRQGTTHTQFTFF